MLTKWMWMSVVAVSVSAQLLSITVARSAQKTTSSELAGTEASLTKTKQEMERVNLASSATTSGPYRLDIGDRLQVTIYERKDLSRVYAVNTEGMIRVPLLGDFYAVGRSAKKIEVLLKQSYQRLLNTNSSVIVEVKQRRPFFVLGLVKTPGAYPHRHEITVLKAIAVAGGIFRSSEQGTRLIDASREIAQLDKTREDLKHALARLARLKAEQSGSTILRLPERLIGLVGRIEAERTIEGARAILTQRLSSKQRRLTASKESIKLSKTEIGQLRQQLEFIRLQLKLKKQQSATLQGLVAKRISSRFQMQTVQGELALLERDLRTVLAGITRSELALVREKRDYDIFISRTQELLNDAITKTSRDVAVYSAAMDNSRRLIRQISSLLVDVSENHPSGSFLYEIVRQTDKGSIQLLAKETTQLRPGDVLRVSAPRASSSKPR